MEQEVLREMVANNRELETQLTKRNEQYIFDLNKSLVAANLSEEVKVLALNEILPQLVEGQKTGKTARQLFGTVSECTLGILEKPEPYRASTMSGMWLDNSLLMFTFLAAVTGINGLFSKGNVSGAFGIITLVISAVSGGYAFCLIYKYLTQYERPGADKSQKPSRLKAWSIVIASLLGWFVIFTASALINPKINIQLMPEINVVLAVASFGIRYVLKKKYHLQGSIMMR